MAYFDEEICTLVDDEDEKVNPTLLEFYHCLEDIKCCLESMRHLLLDIKNLTIEKKIGKNSLENKDVDYPKTYSIT